MTEAVPLRKVCEILNGYAFKSSDYSNGGLRVMRIGNVQKGEIVDNDPMFIPSEIAAALPNFQLRDEDILVSLTGNVGRVGRVPAKLLPAVLNQRVAVIRPRNADISNGYLYQYLNSDVFESNAIKNANGVAQLNLSTKWIAEHQIPLPPLDDQKRIAYLLSKVEGLITQRKQHLQQLDRFLKSVFLTMFGDPIANQRGFAQRKLGTIFTVKHGFAFKSEYFTDEGEYVLLTPGNFREEGGFRDRAERQKFYSGDIPKGYLLRKDDLLIAMTEQAPGLLGSPLIVPAANRFLHNQRLGLIELKEPADKLYLFHLFNHHAIRQIIHSRATGMKVRHTSPTKIEDISVAYPHPDQQKTFARICRACEQVQGIYRESLSELESLFSALSQKAFKGELDLSRVHLPAIAEVNAEIETKGLPEASTDGSIFELPTPANLNELADVKGRNVVVNQWIDAYLQQLGKQSFSTEAFIRLVQQKLSDLQSADDEADIDYEFSAADYDHVKDWIFKNMKSNRLKQDYDDANNRVKISLVKD